MMTLADAQRRALEADAVESTDTVPVADGLDVVGWPMAFAPRKLLRLLSGRRWMTSPTWQAEGAMLMNAVGLRLGFQRLSRCTC
jgi:hypothetical protein